MFLFDALQLQFLNAEKQLSDIFFKEFTDSNFSELSKYHFGFCTWIRNQFLLNENTLRQRFLACGVMNEDDMSLLFIQLFYIYLHEKQMKAP